MGCSLDDSYITFHYAANAAEGQGLVFNTGERHYGSTAMGEAVLLAGLGRGLSAVLGALPVRQMAATPRALIPGIAVALSALSLASMALVWRKMLRRSAPGPASAILLLVLTGYLFCGFPSNFVAGHETCLFVALLFVGAGLALFESRFSGAGAVIGLSTTMRPDAALFALLLGVIVTLQARSRATTWSAGVTAGARFGFAYAAVAVPWALFLWTTFGSPIPDTLTAKRAQVLLGNWPLFTAGKAVSTLLENLPVSLGVLSAVATATALLRAHPFSRAKLARALNDPMVAYALLWIAFAGGQLVVYVCLHVTFYRWYVYPAHYAALGLAVPAAYALEAGASRISRALLGAAVFASFVAFDGVAFARSAGQWASLRNTNEHTAVAASLASFLRELEPDGATIATPEPGDLAYLLGPKFRVVDIIGLTSPGVSRAILEANRNYAFEAWNPEYVVDSWRVATNPAPRPWFATRYELIGEFRAPYWARYLNRGVYLYGLRGRTSKRQLPGGERLLPQLPPDVAAVQPAGPGTRCAVDMIQDTHVRAGVKNEPATGLLRINGWGVDPDAPLRRVFLRLHRETGDFFVEAPIRIRRDDVAQFFRDPRFAESGWQVSADVSGVPPGQYTVDLVLASSAARLCPTRQTVEILAAR
jgi:hypothetical protein